VPVLGLEWELERVWVLWWVQYKLPMPKPDKCYSILPEILSFSFESPLVY
jgi:hypothetical protein